MLRKLAWAQAHGKSASDSTSSEVGDGNLVARVRESSELDVPKQLPTVSNLNDWEIRVALAYAQASGYGDWMEARWLQECDDATRIPGRCLTDPQSAEIH